MVFTVDGKRSYRNPQCALCKQRGWLIPQQTITISPSNAPPPYTPPFQILLDVIKNIRDTTKLPKNSIAIMKPKFIVQSSHSVIPSDLPVQGSNMSLKLLNCTLIGNSCKVIENWNTCTTLTLQKNLSNQEIFFNTSLLLLKRNPLLVNANLLRPRGNAVLTLCPKAPAE